jgi:hypothetical protein
MAFGFFGFTYIKRTFFRKVGTIEEFYFPFKLNTTGLVFGCWFTSSAVKNEESIVTEATKTVRRTKLIFFIVFCFLVLQYKKKMELKSGNF